MLQNDSPAAELEKSIGESAHHLRQHLLDPASYKTWKSIQVSFCPFQPSSSSRSFFPLFSNTSAGEI